MGYSPLGPKELDTTERLGTAPLNTYMQIKVYKKLYVENSHERTLNNENLQPMLTD